MKEVELRRCLYANVLEVCLPLEVVPRSSARAKGSPRGEGAKPTSAARASEPPPSLSILVCGVARHNSR